MEDARDAIFGSKTRVKLLGLFLTSPEKSFYVREITRIIDEQVNSVRRELSNLEQAGVVKSTTEDRKLYYSIDQRFKYYIPLRAIFTDLKIQDTGEVKSFDSSDWVKKIQPVVDLIEVFIISGVLVNDSKSSVDMLIVGDNSKGKISEWAAKIEKDQGRDLNYSIFEPAEFYYRYSARDKFVSQLLDSPHEIVIDSSKIIK